MDSTTMAILMAVAAFAVFGVLYVVFGARRGKAEGHTERTWCLPQGHGDIDVRTETGREIAPKDTCPPSTTEADDMDEAVVTGRRVAR